MNINDNTAIIEPTFNSSHTLNIDKMTASDFMRYAKFTFPESAPNFTAADKHLNEMDADFAKCNDGLKLFNNAQRIYLYHFVGLDEDLFNQLSSYLAMLGEAPKNPLHVVDYNGIKVIPEFAEVLASTKAVEYANKAAKTVKEFVETLFKQDTSLIESFDRFGITIDKPQAEAHKILKAKSNDLGAI